MKVLEHKSKRVFLYLKNLLNKENEYSVKLNNSEKEIFIPLCVEKFSSDKYGEYISLAHYGECNGDAMRDPEICFFVSYGLDSVIVPYYFRNDWMGVYRELDLNYDSDNFIYAQDRRSQREIYDLAIILLENVNEQQKLGVK